MAELGVAQDAVRPLRMDLSGSAQLQVVDLLSKLESRFSENLVLEVLDRIQRGVAGEVGAARSVGARVEEAAVRIAGDDRHPGRVDAHQLAYDLRADRIQSRANVGAARKEDEGAVRQELALRVGLVEAGQARALLDHGETLSYGPVGIVADLPVAPAYHLGTLSQGLLDAT